MIKINLGSASQLLKGFINLDIEPNPGAIRWDIRKGIPFEDVEFINISQCFEHLNLFEARNLLKECYKVLIPGGKLKISVPDMDILIDYMRNGKMDYFANIQPDFFSVGLKSQMIKLGIMGIGNMSADSTREHFTGHQLLLNYDAMKELLEEANFKNIIRVEFNPSYDHKVCSEHSVFVEAIK